MSIADSMSSFQFNDFSGLVPRDNPIQCQTARAPDYYGFGVRLGIYFAWFQAYIANTLLPSEIAGAADTNTIFLLVILIAMIKCSSIAMLEKIDGLILMHLSGGTIFGVLSMWGYRTRQYIDNGPKAIRFFGGFGTHSRLIVSLAISCYGLWYWLVGVHGSDLLDMGTAREQEINPVDTPNPPECQTLYTFMFAKVRADGGIRIFYILVCVCCIIYFGIMLLVSSIAGWARLRKMIELGKAKRWAETTRLRFATGFKYRELEIIFKYLRWLNLAWLIYSIFLVEFSLNFNHVTAVLGGPHDNELHLPAQLLPLLIGTFGFVRTCYLLLESWRSPEDIDPSLSAPSTPYPARTMHPARDVLLAFSPAMARTSITTSHDPNEIDELESHRPRMIRYLVAWLPWLSLLSYFREQQREDNEKRLSDTSKFHGVQVEHPRDTHRPTEKKAVPSNGRDPLPPHHGRTM